MQTSLTFAQMLDAFIFPSLEFSIERQGNHAARPPTFRPRHDGCPK